MTDAEFIAAAAQRGLTAVKVSTEKSTRGAIYLTPFWMIRKGRRELGSWVPSTNSARVWSHLHTVAGEREVLELFSAVVREQKGRGR